MFPRFLIACQISLDERFFTSRNNFHACYARSLRLNRKISKYRHREIFGPGPGNGQSCGTFTLLRENISRKNAVLCSYAQFCIGLSLSRARRGYAGSSRNVGHSFATRPTISFIRTQWTHENNVPRVESRDERVEGHLCRSEIFIIREIRRRRRREVNYFAIRTRKFLKLVLFRATRKEKWKKKGGVNYRETDPQSLHPSLRFYLWTFE